MSPHTNSRRLRQLLKSGCVPMPGVFNGAVARQAERAGFSAVYISGAGLANATAGVPDIGLLSMEEVASLAGYIVRAINIPALIDADTGFGGPAQVAATVKTFEGLGLAGLHIEDQVFPKRCGHLGGKELVPVGAMAAKIRAAVRARQDKDVLIVARTDARAVEGFESALQRAQRYLDAGAEAIFPEALESAEEFRQFAARLPGALLLANMTEFGKSPLLSVSQLARLGYRMVIFPQTAFRVSQAATRKTLENLKRRGTQRAWLRRMQTRKELYQLLDYDPAAAAWPQRKN